MIDVKHFKLCIEEGVVILKPITISHPFTVHGINFIIHKESDGHNVTEVTTGLLLTPKAYKTVEIAIESTDKFILNMGIDTFKNHIKTAYAKYKTEIDTFNNAIRPKVVEMIEI